ncbi:MAG: hypothetical protein A3H02_00570 [Candidatus Niyogibacteria bacterium RIFCSPLOWO2_12_FULL_41_13]|uniref:Uncharacterized protein n=1 Tax=Candidatus Niyogibacteria bacterium RIFCSPLOWO2_12_FULL_41_13 TaxID=1801726 RepID=A0A1G2F2X3_9BACT|nr:MAG: hypothetical protein A3H02_00570 [Candidatus Niyogibacteria bacterium RIFCSPLOWO2_12_FULL_41_13]
MSPLKKGRFFYPHLTEVVLLINIKIMDESKEFWADKLSYWLFLALGFLLPLWFLPFGFSPETNKAYFAYFILLFVFIFWLVGRIRQGRLEFSKNWIFISLFFLVGVYFVSAIFSFNDNLTLFGIGREGGNWLSIAFFALAAFLASEILNRSDRAFFWFLTLFISGILVFIFQALHGIFGFTVYPWSDYFPLSTSNLIGSWNNFGLFFSIIGLLALYFYEISNYLSFKFLFFIVYAVSLIVLFAVNFSLLWWLFGILLVILGVYIFIFRKEKFFRPLIGLGVILVLFFVITPNLASNLSSSVIGVNNIEVRPSYGATVDIFRQTVKENPILGFGPGTFLESWLRYKPQAINSTVFWNTRFENGASFFSTLALNAGFLGLIAVLGFIFAYFYSSFRFIHLIEINHDYLLPLISFLASFYFFVLMILYSPNFINLLLGFIFLGIFIGSASDKNMFPKSKIVLFQTSGLGFISSLVLVFLLILSVSGVYFLAQNYIGSLYFAKGLNLFNLKNDLSGAKFNIEKAFSLAKEPQYSRSLAQLNLIELNNFLSRTDIAPEQLRQNLQAILSKTIQNASNARGLDPNDSLNWLISGQVYESLLSLKIDQAAETARQIYQEAAKIFPTNPEFLLSLARLELQLGNLKESRDYLDRAISLKPDYSSAHFLYARLESQSGNTKEAILRAESAVFISPNDIGSLFQLGLLYYQDKQFDNAKTVFERLAGLAPNYSNGRYFLGLIYDREGATKKAIDEFEKISLLNPEDREIKDILSNLREGKKALSGISSPAERKDLPLEEKTETERDVKKKR